MTTHWITFISWLVFIGFWGVSALNVKKDIKTTPWWFSGRGYVVRVLLAAALLAIIFARNQHISTIFIQRNDPYGSAASQIGATLTVLGVAFAIWARVHLGRNWSSHPTLKEGHELVTSGPYQYVRNPIYTGMLLAALGTVFVAGPVWIIAFVIACIVFVRRVFLEDTLMAKQFPNAYPEYKRKTKALIPFVW